MDKVGKRYRRISHAHPGQRRRAWCRPPTRRCAAQQEVKVYGAQARGERRATRELADRNLRPEPEGRGHPRASRRRWCSCWARSALAVLLVVAGARGRRQGRLTAGGFVTLMIAMMAIIPSLKQLTNVQSMLQRGVPRPSACSRCSMRRRARHRHAAAAARARRARVPRRRRALRRAGPRRRCSDISFIAQPGHRHRHRRPLRQRQVHA